MAMIDAMCQFDSDKALPSTATTEYSTDEVDFGAGKDAFGVALANPDIGKGTPVWLNIIMTEAGVSAGNGTVAINLVHGAATAPTTVLQQICTGLAAASLPLGKKFSMAISDPAILRFARIQVVTTTAGYEKGKYSAWLDTAPLPTV